MKTIENLFTIGYIISFFSLIFNSYNVYSLIKYTHFGKPFPKLITHIYKEYTGEWLFIYIVCCILSLIPIINIIILIHLLIGFVTVYIYKNYEPFIERIKNKHENAKNNIK